MIHESVQPRRPSSTRCARALLLASVAAALSACDGGGASEPTITRFVQDDQVVQFDVATGAGRRAGKVTGGITGVSAVEFQWAPATPPSFTFQEDAVIVDLDGDQVRLTSTGNGTFLTSIDPAVVPTVIELAGSCEVTDGDGKYAAWLGRTFAYRVFGAIPADGLGSVYAEVSSEPF